MHRLTRFVLLVLAAFGLISIWASSYSGAETEWPVYGGDAGSTRYSALDQINKRNVRQLEVAWIHHTGDAWDRGEIQTNPIIIDGVLYGVSAGLRAIALHAGTGERIWTFDPPVDSVSIRRQRVNRGVVYWQDGADRRIFYIIGPRLYALHAGTGRPVTSFGNDGWIDLHDGLGRDVSDRWISSRTPGIIYKDLLIQGTVTAEGRSGAAPGHIRAYDVRTGEIRWVFHTIPHPGEYGYETWPKDAWQTIGGANAWAGLAVDEGRGIVYVPVGAASVLYYGGGVPGQHLFASTLVALDAATGKRIWHYQIIHHDIFDRDLPAPPNLLTVERDGKRIDAVAQVTKQGFVFVFDRETGEPLFPIEERPVPASTLEGEALWPTQPFPVKPAPFVRQYFTEDEITDISPEAHAYVKQRFDELTSEGPFTPPSVEGSIIFPGIDGGAEWGGAAVDPAGILYINANQMPWTKTMRSNSDTLAEAGILTGRAVYDTYCAGCHGADLKVDGDRHPSLLNVRDHLAEEDVAQTIARGQGFMPSFETTLSNEELSAVVAFLFGREERVAIDRAGDATPDRSGRPGYRSSGGGRFLDENGYPAVKPPWGNLTAIDLNSGEFVWQVSLGEFEELTARGVPPTGTENYGGPVVTAGGLLFIAATKDEKFRAFDKDTGEVLWEVKLPAGGYATPSTYELDGKQYIVIAAGGGKMGTKRGDAYVAFALPD